MSEGLGCQRHPLGNGYKSWFCAGDMMGSISQLSVTLDQGCIAPIICDSPAVMLSHRPHAHFAQNVPHDSATSLIRLDAGMLPSPLSHRATSAELVTCSGHQPSNGPTHGTHVAPMIISPDDHHMQGPKGLGFNGTCREEEEEFVLHTVELSSPSAESDSGFDESSPAAASPDSPCDRSILPNSAPGFIISPSPFPQLVSSVLFSSSKAETACCLSDAAPDSAQQSAGLSHAFAHVMDAKSPEDTAEKAIAAEVDDVDALNSLLK